MSLWNLLTLARPLNALQFRRELSYTEEFTADALHIMHSTLPVIALAGRSARFLRELVWGSAKSAY
jgi:hypothetical protein